MNFTLLSCKMRRLVEWKCAVVRRSAAHVAVCAQLIAAKSPRALKWSDRRAKIGLLIACLLLLSATPSHGQGRDEQAPIFPRIRALSLERTRALARTGSATITLAQAKFAQAQAEEKDVARRFKLDTTGGLDPFSRQIRFYVALDLERLLGLNRQEKERARQATEQGRIGRQSAQADAMKGATTAWYALSSANTGVGSAARRKEAAQALYVVADARFKAGQSELSGVMTALQGTYTSEDAFDQARQAVALACLDLAQSCGYATAEELEAALAKGEKP
jgi:hypothetical protein